MTQPAAEPIEELVSQWRRAKSILRPGVPLMEIRAWEGRRRRVLPKEFVDLHLLVDGMDEGDSDEHQIRFWPLAEVAPLGQCVPSFSSDADGLFVFADYCLWAHAYAIDLGSDANQGQIAIVGGSSPQVIAPSFLVFAEYYVHHPARLF